MLVFIIVWYLGVIICTIIGCMKGKVWMSVCGLLLLSPLCIVAAIRLAKPYSSWARSNYIGVNEYKLALSKLRFPEEVMKREAIQKHLATTS